MDIFICECHQREFLEYKKFRKHLYDVKNKEILSIKQKEYRLRTNYSEKQKEYDKQNFERFKDRKRKTSSNWNKTAKHKEYYYNNREICLKKAMEYRNSEHGKEIRKIYENKPERIKRKKYLNALRYQNNREQILQKISEYRNTPQGKAAEKAKDIRRRTILLNGKHSVLTKEKIEQVVEHNVSVFGTLTCELCYKPILYNQYAIDHTIPIIRSEEFPEIDLNDISNLSVAHNQYTEESCNNKKYDYTLSEWFEIFPEYLIRGLDLGHIKGKNEEK
jgi:uncharacterized protein YlzI (FlbEa/FlbD family)